MGERAELESGGRMIGRANENAEESVSESQDGVGAPGIRVKFGARDDGVGAEVEPRLEAGREGGALRIAWRVSRAGGESWAVVTARAGSVAFARGTLALDLAFDIAFTFCLACHSNPSQHRAHGGSSCACCVFARGTTRNRGATTCCAY